MLEEFIPIFYISKDQLEKAHTWQDAHDKEKHLPPGKTVRHSGAIGGAYTWSFTNTSIGTVVKLKCSCGELIDLSDYDTW
jgi:hypothetical protein